MTITLYWEQLKKDIDQITYRLSSSIENQEIKDDASADGLDFSTTFWRRNIMDGIAALKVRLADKLTAYTGNADDTLDTSSSWVFDLDIEEDSKAIAELMHRFVLYYALKAWALDYMPDARKSIGDDYAEAMDGIEELSYKRRPPVKGQR